MKAKLTFENVEFEQDSEKTVRVLKGTSFLLQLMDTGGTKATMATAGYDEVLEVTEKSASQDSGSDSAKILAAVVGVSEFQVQDENRTVVFWLRIEVFSQEAGQFKTTASPMIE